MARGKYVHPSQRAGLYVPTRGAFKDHQFASYRQYQNALAKVKGFGSAAKRLAAPRNVGVQDGLKALTRPSRARAFDALSRMRKGLTIAEAARQSETTVQTVKRYVGKVLRRSKTGRIVPTRSDSMAAYMEVPTTAGSRLMLIIGSRSRNRVNQFWYAADNFITSGIPQFLDPLDGKTINVDGVEIPLLTDRRVLTRLFKEGRMSFESLYAKGLVR